MRSFILGLCAALAPAGLATGEQIVFVAPHSGIEVRNVGEKTLPPDPPTEVFTVGAMTFNLYYTDVIDATGIGFDGPDEAEARQRVRDCLTYLESALNEAGTLDVLFNASETDGGGFLASAGTYYPLANGFFGGSTLERLHDPLDAKPFAGTEEIGVTVDFGHDWHFGSGNPSLGDVDFQSVLLHEFTHGLGFASLSASSGASLFAPTNTYTVFNTFLRRRTGNVTLYSGGGSPVFNGSSADLVSNDVAWGGSEGIQAYLPNAAPGIYAPGTFAQGSSLSHWNTGNIIGGAVMEHAISSGVVKREYSAVDLGGLRDIGYLDAAEPDAGDCTLDSGCPDFQGQGSTLIGFLVGLNQLPPFYNYWSADLDNLPLTVMLDSFELALLREVLCGNTVVSEDAVCAFDANRQELENEVLFAAILSQAPEYVTGLLTISSEFQTAAAALGISGAYVVAGAAKAIGEPLSPSGDPDQDGLTNQEEYDNVIADGGTEADYVEAALNPLLDGSAASAASLPATGLLGLGALLSVVSIGGAIALRRKR